MSETANNKCIICTVYTGHNAREDGAEYLTEMSDLIDYIENEITEKCDAEVIDMMLLFDHMMGEINSWCNELVDTIFIIGHPYFTKFKNWLGNIYNENINKMIENLGKSLTEHINNEEYILLEEIKTKLEPKFHGSVICGFLKRTLIINLFNFNKEEAITCIDVIVTIMQHKYTRLIQEKKNKRKISQAIPSLSNEPATSSSNKTDQVEEDEIKSHKDSYTDEENDMKKKKSPPFHGKMMKMTDAASEIFITIGAKPSSPETFKTEMSILSPDEESSSPEVMEKKLDDTISKQYTMTPVKDALLKIQQEVKYGKHEPLCDSIRTNDAYGRILAEHVYSDCDVPAFRCATKHGYAVLASDGEGRRVVLKGTTSDPIPLIPETCMYVKSGARIPDEATAVVPIKDVKRTDDYSEDLILIKTKPEFGQNIKDIGSDIRKGKLIIGPFTRIGPAELGLLAATGRKEVRVVKPVSIGILSIGDLLVEPEEPLRPGYVYDSNRISLIALLKDQGFNSIVDFGIVTEDILPVKMKIEDALKQVVVLVTIGCSNDNDLLKPILKDDFDATIHFGNVYLKPGKSTTFATCKFDDKLKYLVCLPKNPVSASVSAHLFLLPILNRLHYIEMPCKISARIRDQYILHSRPRAVWATLKWNEDENFARAFSRQNLDSDKPSSSQAANALLLLPPQTEDMKVMCESFVPACPIK